MRSAPTNKDRTEHSSTWSAAGASDGSGRPARSPGLRRSTVADQAYELLRTWLATDRLTPGARISERELAAELEVSRTPLRSALARLENDDLVRRSHSGSLEVVALDARELADLYTCRSSLDSLAARKAAESASREDRARLQEPVDEAARAYVRGDMARTVAANRRFHMLLYEASGNRRLPRALRADAPHFERIGLLLVRSDIRGGAFVAEHQAIVDAIRAGGPAEAERAVREHIASVVSRALATPGAVVSPGSGE